MAKKIAILGPGGIGGFLASVFWKTNKEVTCLAKSQTRELINRNGIYLDSVMFGDFVAYPKVSAKLKFAPDILFVTVKATTLTNALSRINCRNIKPDTIIIPLLNGIEHMKILRERYGRRIAASTISIESFQTRPGHIIHRSPFAHIKLASDGDISLNRLRSVADLLVQCGISAEIGKSEKDVLWDKLVRLNALALTTSFTDQPIGFLRTNPYWRNQLKKCIQEASAIALKEGVRIDFDAEITLINRIDPNQLTSMQRDIAQGKECEIDALAGAIIRKGKKYKITCPTIEDLIKKVQSKINQKSA